MKMPTKKEIPNLGIELSEYFNYPQNKCPNCGWQNNTVAMVPCCPMCQKGVIKWKNEWISVDRFLDPDDIWLKTVGHMFLLNTNPKYRDIMEEHNGRVKRIFPMVGHPRNSSGPLSLDSSNVPLAISSFGAPGKAADAWIDYVNATIPNIEEKYSLEAFTVMMAAYNAVNLETENLEMWRALLLTSLNSGFFGVYLRVREYALAHKESPIKEATELVKFVKTIEASLDEIHPLKINLISFGLMLVEKPTVFGYLAFLSNLQAHGRRNNVRHIDYYSQSGFIGAQLSHLLFGQLRIAKSKIENLEFYTTTEQKIVSLSLKKLQQGLRQYPTPEGFPPENLHPWFGMIIYLIMMNAFLGNFGQIGELYKTYMHYYERLSRVIHNSILFEKWIGVVMELVLRAKTDSDYLSWFTLNFTVKKVQKPHKKN